MTEEEYEFHLLFTTGVIKRLPRIISRNYKDFIEVFTRLFAHRAKRFIAIRSVSELGECLLELVEEGEYKMAFALVQQKMAWEFQGEMDLDDKDQLQQSEHNLDLEVRGGSKPSTKSIVQFMYWAKS